MSHPEQLTKHALSESLKALMRSRPLDRITIEEICQGAGVSRRNFYRYFPDKYALLNWIFYVDFCTDNVHNDAWTIWDYFPAFCQHFYDDRKFYANAFRQHGQNSFREFCYERLYPLLHRDFGSVFHSGEEEEFILRHLCELQFDSFEQWLKAEPCIPPEAYARRIIEAEARFSGRMFEIANRPPAEDAPGQGDLFRSRNE